MNVAADNAARLGANHQLSIVFCPSQKGQSRITVIVVAVVHGFFRRYPIRLDLTQLHLGFPKIRRPDTLGDRPLHKFAVQLPNIIFVPRVQPGLKQQAVFIAENLPCQAGSAIEIASDVIIYSEENHTDSITHIGLTASAPTAVREAMAGVPAVFLAGHLQKVAGMDGQNTGLGNLDRIQGIRQPGKNRIVGLDHHSGGVVPMLSLHPLNLILVQAKLAAEPVDDSAGLLALGALDMAPCPNGFQTAHIRNRSVIRCGRIQRSLEIGQIDVVQAGIMGEHHHLKFVLVHGVVVDLPALREVKDNSQLLLIPVRVLAQ